MIFQETRMIEVTETHAPLVQRLAREFGATWVDEEVVVEVDQAGHGEVGGSDRSGQV